MTNNLFERPVFRTAGDRGLLVEYGNAIDLETNKKVRAMAIAIERKRPAGVIEFIPTYRSLIIIYDPSTTNPERLQEDLLGFDQQISEIEIPPIDIIEVPVCYGGELGPDIHFVAETHSMTQEDVIRIHSEPDYQVYMIGFTPGFPFLGGLPEVLHTPRLESPRSRVPAGSVGIANAQTGIYSIESPGGWQIIGRTPIKLFDPERSNPFLLKAGDILRFKPILLEEYNHLAKEGET
jgi:inhibitor of KinA